MRRLIALLALLPTMAMAQTPAPKPVFVTKAPVARAAPAPVVCTLNQCSVWFVGPSIAGMGNNIDIIGQGISNSVFSNGGMVAGSVGGQFWNNGIFLGAENMAGWAFGAPSSVNGVGTNLSGGLDILWFEAGGSLGDLFGSGATPVPINTALAADLISLYFGTGPAQPFGSSSLGTKAFWTTGAGARYLIPNASRPLLLDIKYVFGNNTNNTGLTTNKNMNLVAVTLGIPFNW